MYQIAKDHLSSREQRLLKKHLESIQQLKSAMDRQYKAYIRSVAEEMETFMQILDQAFVMDVHVAFEGSIKLARAYGMGTGFAVGLILLPSIFHMILGFGDSTYYGPVEG